MLTAIFLAVLIVLLIVTLPTIGGFTWGYGPSGGIAVLIVIVVLLLLLGKV